jgi:hypothetical protein
MNLLPWNIDTWTVLWMAPAPLLDGQLLGRICLVAISAVIAADYGNSRSVDAGLLR